MKLVFIYGPPGVGKFTVGKQLAKITGYKLFPNYLTSNLVEPIFGQRTKKSHRLIYKYRRELIEAAAKWGIRNLISTHVYKKPKDNNHIRKIIRIIKQYRGRIYFVRLYCDLQELFRRIKHPSRRKFPFKIKTIKDLKEYMRHNVFCSIPHVKSLVIDNTKLSPKKVAEEIKNYYKLK